MSKENINLNYESNEHISLKEYKDQSDKKVLNNSFMLGLALPVTAISTYLGLVITTANHYQLDANYTSDYLHDLSQLRGEPKIECNLYEDKSSMFYSLREEVNTLSDKCEVPPSKIIFDNIKKTGAVLITVEFISMLLNNRKVYDMINKKKKV